MKRSTALWWGVRLAALGLVAFVLASQIHWRDRLTRADGTVLKGQVEQLANGDWRVVGRHDVTDVKAADVATRGGQGGRPVPDVSWGLRSLGARLAGQFPLLLLVLLVLVSMHVLTAWRWRMLLRTIDLHLPYGQAVRLTFIGAFFNLAVPGATGGDVVKAWYAAKVTGRGTRSVISVFVDRAIGMLGLAVFAGAVLVVAPAREGYGPAKVVVAVVLGTALVALLVFTNRGLRRFFGLSSLARRLPFQTLLAEARAALHLYRGHPSALLLALGISLVNHATTAVCVWVLAGALGLEGLELGTALALVPVANLFSAVPVLPGGWGVGELAFAYLLGQVGIPPTEAVSLSVVFRLSMLAVSVPGGVLWLGWKGHPTKADIEKGVEDVAQEVETSQAVEA